MDKVAAIYLRAALGSAGTPCGQVDRFQRAIADAADVLGETYVDDANIAGRGKNAGWRRLMADLEGIDQIVLANAVDLPSRTVADLLRLLTKLSQHGIAVVVPSVSIDTSSGSAAALNLLAAYRRAKWTVAIRAGQVRAQREWQRIGRPPIPIAARSRIAAALLEGAGIRPTAREFNISPASVVAIRRELVTKSCELAGGPMYGDVPSSPS